MNYLHIISHPTFFEGEAEVITDLLLRFDVVVHIRKPEASESDYSHFVSQIPKALYPKIVVHSAYDLAGEYTFAGLHFSTTKRKMANDVLVNVNKSTSCHSLGEVKCLPRVFYSCFLSPVFPSISKEGYSGNLNLEEVRIYLSEVRRIKLIALGGIHQGNIREIQDMGFDGAAVLGAVWGKSPSRNDDFIGRVKALVER